MPQQKQQQDQAEADSRPGSAARKLPAPPPGPGPHPRASRSTHLGRWGRDRQARPLVALPLWHLRPTGDSALGTRGPASSTSPHSPCLPVTPPLGGPAGGSGHSSSSSTSRPGRCPAAGGPGTASRYCPGGSGCPARAGPAGRGPRAAAAPCRRHSPGAMSYASPGRAPTAHPPAGQPWPTHPDLCSNRSALGSPAHGPVATTEALPAGPDTAVPCLVTLTHRGLAGSACHTALLSPTATSRTE